MNHDCGKMISRAWLERRLVRAAQVRAAVTMLGCIPLAVVGAAILGNVLAKKAAVLLFFGSFFGLERAMTYFYCRRKVKCPYCGSSLWDCGTGNFKPRRLRIREDAAGCTTCGARLD